MRRAVLMVSWVVAIALLAAGCAAPPMSASYTQEGVVADETFGDHPAIGTAAFVIPGLVQEAIPQGIDYDVGRDWALVSSYHRDGAASTLSVVELSTGAIVKAVRLQNANGSVHTSHAGGVAMDGTRAWVASQGKLFELSMDDIAAARHMDAVRIAREIAVPNKASFASVTEGILWVGEFFHTEGDYATDASHHLAAPDGTTLRALCAGYRLDGGDFRLGKGGVAIPDYMLSIADRIQGFARLPDGRFALSQSYGRANDSALLVYRDVLQDAPQGSFAVGGEDVPLWYLDTGAEAARIVAPPMAEGITVADGDLLVLFESGATYYRTNGAINPTDEVWTITLDNR